MLELNKVYKIDALEGMRMFKDFEIDLIVTDPPYGIGESNEKNLARGKWAKPTDYGHYDWDKQKISKPYFDEMFRISKNQIIFGGNYYVDYLYNSSCWIVWDKKNGKNDFADCEMAWTSFNTAVRKFDWRWSGMLQELPSWKEKRYHPTQKPVPLMMKIIDTYSKEDDVILDPFCGSGSTLVACEKLGRKFIGFDNCDDYVRISEKRINSVPTKLEDYTKLKQ